MVDSKLFDQSEHTQNKDITELDELKQHQARERVDEETQAQPFQPMVPLNPIVVETFKQTVYKGRPKTSFHKFMEESENKIIEMIQIKQTSRGSQYNSAVNIINSSLQRMGKRIQDEKDVSQDLMRTTNMNLVLSVVEQLSTQDEINVVAQTVSQTQGQNPLEGETPGDFLNRVITKNPEQVDKNDLIDQIIKEYNEKAGQSSSKQLN